MRANSTYLTTACAGSAGTELAGRLLGRMQQHGSVRCPQRPPDGQETNCIERQAWIDGADAVVAEMSSPDASVGSEVFYALHKRRIPTLCLVPRGQPPIPMLTGNSHPLLRVREYSDSGEADRAIDAFLTPPAQPGRVFVVDGGDGAGKQTQTATLMGRLRAEGFPVCTMDFPHDSALHGKLIRKLLSGAMGDIKQVNPLLFASLYAENRHDVLPYLDYWLRCGYNVILDRYVEANFGHQASKLEAADRPPLIEALVKFEHDWLGLPRAHRVIYLDLPAKEALKALAADGTRGALDMHETAGDDYKKSVRETFVWCSQNYDHWRRIECVDAAGERITKEDLAETLYNELKAEFVNRGVKTEE